MSEWKEVRLGNVCETNKSQYSIKENWHHFKYLDTGNITKGQIDEIQPFDSFERLPSRARRKVFDGDIIYSSVRPNQEHYGYISNPPEELLVSTGFVVISANKDIVNPIFLYNFLTQPEITKYLQAIGEQSVCTYPAIKPSDIENLVINIPSLETQEKIASILSALDDKIAVNRRICENLEAQAQALFKHWFIDFAPFKDGKFVESELGMIPEGWRVGTLGEIAEFKRGKTITKENTKEGNIPVVAGGLEPAYYHNESNTSSRVITISGSGANAGFTRMYYVPVWASDCSFVDSASTSFLHTAYCYLLSNKKKVDALQWGAAQPHVYAKDINKLPLTIAPFEVLIKFEELVVRMFDSMEIYEKENLRLSTLRDTLLPKLMSGQIKV